MYSTYFLSPATSDVVPSLIKKKKQNFCLRTYLLPHPSPPHNSHLCIPSALQFLPISQALNIDLNQCFPSGFIHPWQHLAAQQPGRARNYSLSERLMSCTSDFAIILLSSAKLDSSHDVSRFEGYPLRWITISYATTTVRMAERSLSYLKLSFKTSQK